MLFGSRGSALWYQAFTVCATYICCCGRGTLDPEGEALVSAPTTDKVRRSRICVLRSSAVNSEAPAGADDPMPAARRLAPVDAWGF